MATATTITLDLDNLNENELFESVEIELGKGAAEGVLSLDGNRIQIRSSKPEKLQMIARQLDKLSVEIMAAQAIERLRRGSRG